VIVKKNKMANQFQVDKSKQFIQEGMTLISEMSSEKYLRRHKMDLLREINNDKETPKNRRDVNEDGLFEAEECDSPDHVCKCGQKTLSEHT